MNVNNLKLNDQKITITLYILIFLNYLTIFFTYNYVFNLVLSYLIVVFFFLCLININKNNHFLKFLLIIFLIFCLGSPTFHFDARWIWLLKGKQIFLNNDLEFLKEDYFQGLVWQSYPLLGPSLASSIANIFGYWNEVFPKAFSLILSVPPLIYLNSIIKKKVNKLFFILIIIFVLEKSIIIGEMDGLVSIYFVTVFIIFFKKIFRNSFFSTGDDKFIFSKNENLNILFFTLSVVFMTLMKKESLLLIFILVISLIFAKFILKKIILDYKHLIISLLCLLPLLFWEIFLSNEKIFTTEHPTISNLFNGGILFVFNRIFDFRDILLINSKILINKPLFISLIFFFFVLGGLFIKINKLLDDKGFKYFIFYLFITIALYILAFNLIYLVTSYDLSFHLRTSASRTMLPISFLISYSSLVLIEKFSLYKFKKN